MQIGTAPGYGPAWLRLGFRPFFLVAGGYAVVSMLVWLAIYPAVLRLPLAGLAGATWHGHEMIFGYGMAVVAGFLLTAVRNWTGVQTLRGNALLFSVLFWLLARVFLLAGGPSYLAAAACFDVLFGATVAAAVSAPILSTRQWHNLAIAGKVVLLAVSNLVFYLGAAGILEHGVRWGLYSGLYLLVALVLTIARRVLPFFIERGVGGQVRLYNNRWVDIGSLVLFVLFWMAELARPDQVQGAVLAGLLAVLNSVRLVGWHTPALWKRPLLWILYLAYAAIIAGFVLKTAAYVGGLSATLAVHAFAVGGIGLMTLGMMSRVALGHTGRDVLAPPAALRPTFLLLVAALLVRVLLPVLMPSHYALWIVLSQGLWVLAFVLFLLVYTPVLTRPRVDGLDG